MTRIPLTSKYIRDWSSSRLCGEKGAHRIVADLSTGPPAHRLNAGHNDLTDAGGEIIFAYLSSPPGLRHPIEVIALDATRIGDGSLRALAVYLKGNRTVREVMLQNNQFAADPPTIVAFVAALNTSSVQRLVLSSNFHSPSAAASFAAHFFPALAAPHLSFLLLKSTYLPPTSAPLIAAFLASPRARALREIVLGVNKLGLKGGLAIMRAVVRENKGLVTCEVFASSDIWDWNWEEVQEGARESAEQEGEQEQEEEEEEEEEEEDRHARWIRNHDFFSRENASLRRALVRNFLNVRETANDAVELLRHARPALLSLSTHSRTPATYNTESPSSTARRVLPVELILHILSFLAPRLSPRQLTRVVAYAADPRTLPELLQLPTWQRKEAGRASHVGGAKTREMWLCEVGCDAFELELELDG